jgi:MoxR-like ATPase
MKISEVKPLITQVQQANDSMLMTGVHGIGKSEVVEEWAKENDVHLEILFLSNQEVGDLVGVPHNETIDGLVVEKWSVPSWMQRLHDAVFPSEFDREDLIFEDKEFEKYVDLELSKL